MQNFMLYLPIASVKLLVLSNCGKSVSFVWLYVPHKQRVYETVWLLFCSESTDQCQVSVVNVPSKPDCYVTQFDTISDDSVL